MRQLLAPLPATDGIACFTRLYVDVTEAVSTRLASATFGDPIFLERLDIAFANLYFEAIDAYAQDAATVPRAWLPLFEARSRRGIAPLQFALAGMNAHINRDLPVALVATSRALNLDLRPESPQHADFERVNDVLADVEQRLTRAYLSGWVGRLDRLLHRVHRIDDVIAMWNVRKAREAAWTNARALWSLRDDPGASAEYLRALDRMVGFAGRGLLVPADTTLRRAARRLSRLWHGAR